MVDSYNQQDTCTLPQQSALDPCRPHDHRSDQERSTLLQQYTRSAVAPRGQADSTDTVHATPASQDELDWLMALGHDGPVTSQAHAFQLLNGLRGMA